MGPYRVPAVYLTSAFLRFFSVLLFRGISKLRSINPPEGFDSHPGHHFCTASSDSSLRIPCFPDNVVSNLVK